MAFYGIAMAADGSNEAGLLSDFLSQIVEVRCQNELLFLRDH